MARAEDLFRLNNMMPTRMRQRMTDLQREGVPPSQIERRLDVVRPGLLKTALSRPMTLTVGELQEVAIALLTTGDHLVSGGEPPAIDACWATSVYPKDPSTGRDWRINPVSLEVRLTRKRQRSGLGEDGVRARTGLDEEAWDRLLLRPEDADAWDLHLFYVATSGTDEKEEG